MPDVTYILLDFEGLGSFERSAQEDMLLSARTSVLAQGSRPRSEQVALIKDL